MSERAGRPWVALAACLVVYAMLLLRGYEAARLDAHSEIYLAEAHGLVRGWDIAAEGPRIGPLPVRAGPVSLWPYLVAAALGLGVFGLLVLKGLCVTGALALMGSLVARAGGTAAAGLIVLGCGLSTLLDGEALNLRTTSFLPLPLVGALYAMARGLDGSSRGWWALAGGLVGLTLSTHLVSGTLVIPLGVALLWHRDLRAALWAAGALVLVCLPLLWRVGLWLLGGGEPTPDAPAVAASPVPERLLFAGQVLFSREPHLGARLAGAGAAVAAFAGVALLAVRVVRHGPARFPALLLLQLGLGLGAFLLAARLGNKEYYLYAMALPLWVAGGIGVAPLTAGRRWLTAGVLGIIALVGLEQVLPGRGAERIALHRAQLPPSAIELEGIAAGLTAAGLRPADIEQRVHGVARSGDAGLRLLARMSGPPPEPSLGAGEHVAIGWGRAPAPLAVGGATRLPIPAPGRPFPGVVYRPAVDYPAVRVVEPETGRTCWPALPFRRMSLGPEAEARLYDVPIRRDLCEGMGRALDPLVLQVPIAPGPGGQLNLVVDPAGATPRVTAQVAGEPTDVRAGGLPARWPQRLYRIDVPARRTPMTVTVTIRDAALASLIDVY